MVTGFYIRNMLLFVPAPQKKKRPTSFADELAARIKGEVPAKQDEECSSKLTLVLISASTREIKGDL